MRAVARLLLLANLLFGIGMVAMLPPFEGIDETAHYSRIEAEAFADRTSGITPDQKQHIADDVFDYYRRGPMPYEWISFEPLHTRDALRGYMTYDAFFKQPERVKAYVSLYRTNLTTHDFAPGPELNWQYQHPPLYYRLMALPMKVLAGHVPMVTALLILRLLSYGLAFAGLCIGVWATGNHLAKTGYPDAAPIMVMGWLYPFLMPEYFWEFGRLGNDSLCLFLFGIGWAMLLWQLRDPREEAWLYLALSLGLACLTKAFMIPVTCGVMGFLVLHHAVVVRKNPAYAKDWWQSPLKAGALLFLVVVPIYGMNYLHSGSFGAVDFEKDLSVHKIMTLFGENFSWRGYLSNLGDAFNTAVWITGGWSKIILDSVFYRFYAVLTGVVLVGYLAGLFGQTSKLFVIPVWVVAPMLIGLGAHAFLLLLYGLDELTPGYYLHVFAPALAVIYGLGLMTFARVRFLRMLAVPILGVAVLTNFYIVFANMAVFSGCAMPTNVSKNYRLFATDVLPCVQHLDKMEANLGVLAWPPTAGVCFGLTLAVLVMAALYAIQAQFRIKASHNKPIA